MDSLINATGELLFLSTKDVVRKIYRIEPSIPITLTKSVPDLKISNVIAYKVPVIKTSVADGYSDPDDLLSSDAPIIVTKEVAIYIRYNHPELSNKELYVVDDPFVVESTGEAIWYNKLLMF